MRILGAKIFATCASAAAIAAVSSLCHAGDMDLVLRLISQKAASGSTLSKSAITEGETVFIHCIIKSADVESTLLAIREAGGGASNIADGIVTAKIPAESVESIAGRWDVIFAEAATPLSRKMDTARAADEVDVVQDGSALGTAYLGTNVVVGVVDDALDYGNPDFMGTNGYTRIQYVSQALSGGTLTCTKRTIADGSCAISDGGQGLFHGTNVTGIATGSNATYLGVAPAADIMFIFNDASDPSTSSSNSNSFSASVLDAVTTIFDKATIMDKPAVVNISMGTSVGPHDGTSLLENGLSALTAAKAGRIVVNAAGNEQTNPLILSSSVSSHIGGIHAQIAAAAGTSAGHRIIVLSGSASADTFVGGTFADVWLDTDQKDSCSIAAFAYTNGRASNDFTFPGLTTTGDSVLATGNVPFSIDTTTPVTGTGNNVTATIQVASSDPRNLKPHATVLFSPASGSRGTVLNDAWFDIVIRSTGAVPCSGHMWLYFDDIRYHDFLKDVGTGAFNVGDGPTWPGYSLIDGDGFYTTTIPATATGVIAAGSYMPPKPVGASTSKWTGDNGTTYDQSSVNTSIGCLGSTTNDLSTFSSLGPTADGRTKPEIVAPGEPIISTKARDVTISSALTVGGDHFKEAGTSMSSPYITGVVALLLERNNTLGVDAVRTALAAGASTSGLVTRTTDPANSFGAGKVEAASVLRSVSENHSAYSGTGDLDPPVPATSSSCSLNPGSNHH